MNKIPLKYHKRVLFYTKYTHPTLICRGTDGRTHGRTDGRTENIYSIFRDKLLLLGEHGLTPNTEPEKWIFLQCPIEEKIKLSSDVRLSVCLSVRISSVSLFVEGVYVVYNNIAGVL